MQHGTGLHAKHRAQHVLKPTGRWSQPRTESPERWPWRRGRALNFHGVGHANVRGAPRRSQSLALAHDDARPRGWWPGTPSKYGAWRYTPRLCPAWSQREPTGRGQPGRRRCWWHERPRRTRKTWPRRWPRRRAAADVRRECLSSGGRTHRWHALCPLCARGVAQIGTAWEGTMLPPLLCASVTAAEAAAAAVAAAAAEAMAAAAAVAAVAEAAEAEAVQPARGVVRHRDEAGAAGVEAQVGEEAAVVEEAAAAVRTAVALGGVRVQSPERQW
jgi:hypothetical protein